MNKESIIDQLYAPAEIEEAFKRGRDYERFSHQCKTVTKVVVKKVHRKEHPRSHGLKYGVVSNGQLLNPTFATETEAATFMAGLVPANKAARMLVKIDAQVIKLI